VLQKGGEQLQTVAGFYHLQTMEQFEQTRV